MPTMIIYNWAITPEGAATTAGGVGVGVGVLVEELELDVDDVLVVEEI